MNANSFNTKVNLPKFCAKLGYNDYQFKRLPTFGWFAYNADKSFVGNIFDLVGQKDKEYLYSLICKQKPEYLDFDLSYSDMVQTRINYNLLELQLWTAAYAFAKRELETYKFQHNGKRVLMKDLLVENGFAGAIENGVGVITRTLLDKFDMLPWPKVPIVGKLMVPTFCTPQHVCSLEYCSWDTPTEMHMIFLNDEKGWYGNIKHNRVLANIKEVWTTPGNTWDAKADHWYPNQVIELSEFISADTMIRIWNEADNTAFNKSPLDHIIETGQMDNLKNQIGQLTLTQIQEAEKKTGEQLIKHWKKARECQIQVGRHVFTRRDNRYWIYKKGRIEEVTNFAVEIEKIYKKEGQFYRKGYIYYGEQIAPFDLEDKYFTTNYMFHKGMREKFLTAGLGVPIVHPDFFGKALLIVDSFNPAITIDVEDKAIT